jgi:hypothetical protein
MSRHNPTETSVKGDADASEYTHALRQQIHLQVEPIGRRASILQK